jgi:hypothetical protein
MPSSGEALSKEERRRIARENNMVITQLAAKLNSCEPSTKERMRCAQLLVQVAHMDIQGISAVSAAPGAVGVAEPAGSALLRRGIHRSAAAAPANHGEMHSHAALATHAAEPAAARESSRRQPKRPAGCEMAATGAQTITTPRLQGGAGAKRARESKASAQQSAYLSDSSQPPLVASWGGGADFALSFAGASPASPLPSASPFEARKLFPISPTSPSEPLAGGRRAAAFGGGAAEPLENDEFWMGILQSGDDQGVLGLAGGLGLGLLNGM